MKLASTLLASMFLTTAAPLQAQQALAPPEMRTLAEFPNGTFLENITPIDDGAFAFTSYFDKKLMRLNVDGSVGEIAVLPDHPVGIVRVDDGFIVSAHGKPFSDAPAFTSTNKVLLLNPDGLVRVSQEAPHALFLNGLVRTDEGNVLVADSLASTIWEIDPETGTLAPWLTDEALSQDPAQTVFRPGANGLKEFAGQLYVSNSSRGMIYRIAGQADDGTLEPFATTGPVDDFVFDDDGSIYATTHGDAILKVTTDGTVSNILTQGCDGCTSIVLLPSDKGVRLVFLTTGGLLEGRQEPARIIELDLPEG